METDSPAYLVYKVVIREDGSAQFTLSGPHRAFLAFLAANGGETMMDWDAAEKQRTSVMESRPETIREHMAHLARLGLTAELHLIGGNRSLVRLTDAGRNIASQLLGA